MNRRKMLQQAAAAIAGLCLFPCRTGIQPHYFTTTGFVGSIQRGYPVQGTMKYRDWEFQTVKASPKHGIATTDMEFELG